MAEYSKWADIAKTGVNGLNWQQCGKTNKNFSEVKYRVQPKGKVTKFYMTWLELTALYLT